MSKKVFNVFSILCFALVLCFMGCTELINPKTETDINLNIDLSKIIKSTRNTGETQSSASLGVNPTIKVAIYDAKKYNATTNSTVDLDLITEAQAKIVDKEAKVKLNNIPVGIYAIVFAELSFSNGNSTEVMYAGNSEVFKVEASNNKISLVLTKVGNSETSPDDSNTPYDISSWDELKTQINKLSDDTTPTEFIIMNNLTATSTITVSKPIKIIAESPVTITRGNTTDNTSFTDVFFKVETSGSLELEGKENSTITLDGNDVSSTNYGGAVYVSGGTFTMNYGVTITKCKAKYGGAVYITDKGTFNMNGGFIAGCSASNSGGGVWMNRGSSFTMSGGKIYNCNSSFEGGGVYVIGEDNPCTFEMLDNATIIECSAEGGYGGGVYVTGEDNPCTFMLYNANITRCSAEKGGGGVSYGCGPNGTFEISGEAKIDNNRSGYYGGGIYLYGKLTMTGGTISSNEVTNGNGDGVYVRNDNGVLSSLSVSGNAVVESNDDVYLESGTTVTVAGALTHPIVATITPQKCEEGTQVITAADDGISLEYYVGRFTLSNEEYCIDYNGMIATVSQNYAEGLTCKVDSVDTVTLYISSAKGLAIFRNIVNGSLTENISVRYNDNSTSKRDFSVNSPQLNINAVLETDIDLNNESWTPIGKNSTDGYKGTFDGANHEIKNLFIESSDQNPQGLFCSVYGGTVKNLVVQGKITSSYYTGGITGYLNGGTIENCVNNVEIINSAVNGTGGIVGYVDSDGGTIQNCINLVSVTGGNSVGGIVGEAGPNSLSTIKKCINIGDIKAPNGIASGIATTNSSSSSSILDCINLGSIDGNFACGIVYNSEGYTSVSNCISIGSLTGTYAYAIASSFSGFIFNNYYDSKINSNLLGSDINGIEGKSTSDLIGKSILLTDITTENWSFAEGRYLLPNIAGSIPGGEDGEIWQTVIDAAKSESTGTSGGGIDGTYVSTVGELKSALEDASVKTILINANISIDSTINITRDITIAANNDFTITQNVTDYEMINVAEDVNFVLGGGSGTLTIMGNSSLTKNIIYSKGNVTLKDKLVINNSYASNGVIFIYAGSLKMEGGEISNNQSNAITSSMGDSDVTIDIYGGKIYNNTKDNQNYGSAIYIISSNYNNATVNIYGKAQIYNNDNPSGAAIRLNDADSVLYINSSASENSAAIYDNTTTNIQIDAGQLFINNTEIDLSNYTDSNI